MTLSAAAPLFGACSSADGMNGSSDNTVREASRNVKVARSADVIVSGGGPAGVCAAIASARAGADTVLIEQYGFLGGIWTAGMLSWIMDYVNKPESSILKEIFAELKKNDAQDAPHCYDSEVMKTVLESMCIKAGVKIRCYTRVCSALKDFDGGMTAVLTESPSGREAWRAKVFIDATGNGDLSAYAGCRFEVGDADGNTMPGSLMALLAGVKNEDLAEAGVMRKNSVTGDKGENKKKFRALLNSAGMEPSYKMPSLFPVREGLIAMMANHEYGVKCDDADSLTAHTIAARAEISKMTDILRGLGGIWKDLRLVATAPQIGIREGRRIRGVYTVSVEDLKSGARFADAVCAVTLKLDIHPHNKDDKHGYTNYGIKTLPYEIPLRALMSADIPNLLLAGRCISGDYFAHSSYRVTGNSCVLGEAAGKAAAASVRLKKPVREVKVHEFA